MGLVLSSSACGGAAETFERAKDAASDLGGAVADHVGRAVEAANNYVEAPQLEVRERACAQEGGEWVALVRASPCIDGEVELEIDGEKQRQRCSSGTGGDNTWQCVHRTASGEVYFNDGPTVPPSMTRAAQALAAYDLQRWMVLFWPAGVNHDYCYHHNGMTYGLTQKDCDTQMLSDLSAVCAAPGFAAIDWFDAATCRQHAAMTYAVLRACGGEYFDVLNSQVDYPAWQPLWQQYGLEHDALDAEMQAQVDEAVANYSPL